MTLRSPKSLLVVAVVGMLGLFVVASASAQTTIGELAPGANPALYCENGPWDGAPTGPAAAAYTVPSAGVITSWSTNAGAGPGQQLTFKVYRPLGGGNWMVVGHDGPRLLAPSAIDTFSTDIPVQAGDVIGNVDVNADAVPTACEWETGDSSDTAWVTEGDAADGATVAPNLGEFGVRFNETATLLTAPTIASVSPGTGPAAGGTAITIGGQEFAQVRSVTIGSTAVPFNVASETSITATAPAGTAGTSVPVTVTTIAGSATSSFAYEAAPVVPIATVAPPAAAPPTVVPSCKVPKLKGKKLKAAKAALQKAHCKLGKVMKKKGATAKKAKVVAQSPGPGRTLSSGSKVSVKLG